MKIELQTTNHMEFTINWEKSLDAFQDEILYASPLKSLLTDSGEYVIIGHIVSFKVLGEQ